MLKETGENRYRVKDRTILKYLWEIEGSNPILLSNILHAKMGTNVHAQKLAQLLAMAVSVMMTSGNMRLVPTNSNNSNDRPARVWRQTGYLHSCVDVLVRSKII